MISTFFDLCSGIGGGRLGLEKEGMKCVAYCDTSKLSKRTYDLMHDTTNEEYFYNLKTIKTEKIPAYDMLIAGFPCQTFSVIGRKDGFDDKRGQLIFHIARILIETQPKCFLLENVKGLVTHDKGKTIQIIMDSLSGAGYAVTYKVLNSLDYGVPQMRQRVYFVGIRNDIKKSIDAFEWPSPIEKPDLMDYLVDGQEIDNERMDILKYYLCNPTNKGRYTIEDLLTFEGKILDTRMNDLRIYDGKCPTLRSQRDGVLYVKNHTLYALSGYEALLLQGFPKEYATKVKDVVSNRHLLMQAGNAMTVNVISAIVQSIKKHIEAGEEKENMPSQTWRDFEIACTEYLNRKSGSHANFTHQGEENSTRPDILVETKSGKSFYIEVKHSPAQSGQFVLLENIAKKSFEYSSRNVNVVNEYSSKITKYMNDNYDVFQEPSRTGENITMPSGEAVYVDWIVDTYQRKNVKFVITNDYLIFPIERFGKYFSVTAKYRVKKSGSSAVGVSKIEKVKEFIIHNYDVNSIRIDNDKLFVTSDLQLQNEKFCFENYQYMFSQRGAEYEIRKLSNTNNANVIFSITKKESPSGLSDEDFLKELK